MWKTWRSILNPGFSSQHLMTLVPKIMISRNILQGNVAPTDMFPLEDIALNVTIDIIRRVAL